MLVELVEVVPILLLIMGTLLVFGNSPAVETIARIQAMADKNIRKYGLLAKEAI